MAVHIGTLFNIPIRIHWSFLAVLGLVIFWSGFAGWFGAFALVIGLFGSVVLHELGHALAARRYGIQTAHITLYPFGGIAAIEKMPEEPSQELVIALAGPAVNFALVAGFGWLWSAGIGSAALWIAALNLGMGVFNLIPAFPMDGGRVLRALLATRMGWVPASYLAIRIGRGFAWLFLALSAYTWSVNWLMMGIFLHVALNAEKQRLIYLVWERTRRGQSDWDSVNPWGGRTS
ncbi:MAG: Zn-dependent protease [Rhodobacterales bacterium]|nr:Zn-dependent protease [Rhodobacterales bacterium]